MTKKEVFPVLKSYLFTWVLVIVLFIFNTLKRGTSFTRAFDFFKELLTTKPFLLGLHVAFILIYLLFLILRYFYRLYLKKGIKIAALQATIKFVLPLIVLVLSYKFLLYTNANEGYLYEWDTSIENTKGAAVNQYATDKKHRGMSVFGWNEDNELAIKELLRNNVEWVAVTPFYFQKGEQTKVMNVPDQIGVWSKRDSSFISSINQIQRKGIHVNLKPHLWMSEGWRSNINFSNASDWATWFESYRKNMIHHAKMAALTNVEMLCIGTELKSSLKKQPKAWLSLIKEIKSIYTGKLTYAANWDDSFDQKDFWKELDYIGIQAYFPLTKMNNPGLASIKKGWDRHIKRLEEITANHNKPILFTEVGYKSEASATIKPWEWDSFSTRFLRKKSDQTQQLAYEAMFQRLWQKEWFQGAYIWQWDTRSTKENSYQDFDFSPRFKPAENTIAKWYGFKTP